MTTNALTEVAWIPTKYGFMTPQQALSTQKGGDTPSLIRPSDIQCDSAMDFMATIRFLAAVMAVARRFWTKSKKQYDEDAIKQAIELLAPYCSLRDSEHPFMQQPVTPDQIASTKFDPPTKLDVSTPSSKARDFWHLMLDDEAALPPAKATLNLVKYHYYSVAGNNKFNGLKCEMGAPGIRFLGANNTATEMMWFPNFDEPAAGKQGTAKEKYEWTHSLVYTLLMNIPHSWVEGDALPAWAHRVPSRTEANHPLWRATWSSNTVAAHWDDDNNLVGVKVGGVPPSWFAPEHGTTKETRKAWWDERNTEDPFYLYIDRGTGLKAQRLEFGHTVTELAVQWNANRAPSVLRDRGYLERVIRPSDPSICFARHLVAGTGSSPVIRASEIFIPHVASWLPSDDYDEAMASTAEVIQEYRNALRGTMHSLEALKEHKEHATSRFWMELTPYFEAYAEDPGADGARERLFRETGNVTLAVFNDIARTVERPILPYVEVARNRLKYNIRTITKKKGASQ